MWLGKARKHLQLQMVATIQINIFIMFLEKKNEIIRSFLESCSQQCNLFFKNQFSFAILLRNMNYGCIRIMFLSIFRKYTIKTKANNVTKPNEQIKSKSKWWNCLRRNYRFNHQAFICIAYQSALDPRKSRFVIVKPWF